MSDPLTELIGALDAATKEVSRLREELLSLRGALATDERLREAAANVVKVWLSTEPCPTPLLLAIGLLEIALKRTKREGGPVFEVGQKV